MAELDSERQKQAKEYAKQRNRLGSVNFLVSTVLLLLLVLTPVSSAIADKIPGTPPLAAALYLVILMIVYDLLTVPLSYRNGYKLPQDFGLLHQTFSSWVFDHLKSLGIGIGFGATLVAGLFFLIEHYPAGWWLIAWFLLEVITEVFTVLAPVLLIPLFYKMRRLGEGSLKERLNAIANTAKVKVSGIFIIEFSEKTTLANAAVMGLGGTKRIVISDTLVNAYTPEEIDIVMAHELGHQRHGDVWRLFAFQSILYLGVIWLASWLFGALVRQTDYVNYSNPAALPLLLFCFAVAGSPTIPVLSWFSRKLESAADVFALELTRKPDVFISAMTKLTDQNLGQSRATNFIDRIGQDHPSYLDRVKMAEMFSAENLPKNG